MSLVNSLKGLLGKGKEAAAQNADKIHDAVDKAGSFVDGKTGGKYSDKIAKGTEAAKKAVPPQEPGTGSGGPTGGPKPTDPGTAPGGPTPTDPGPKA
ncbi:antitoxin [Nocardia halotolerans]|uniref:Antitoxin n=1 Tax=Nocardia halotolerans TaxID=1755878 RepID=A0ABV8VNZ1_9NOCA